MQETCCVDHCRQWMTLREFIELGENMRAAQKQYSATGDRAVLPEKKRLEKLFDQATEAATRQRQYGQEWMRYRLLNEQGLFGFAGGGGELTSQ